MVMMMMMMMMIIISAPSALSVGLDMYTLLTARVRCLLDCVFKILSTKQQYETPTANFQNRSMCVVCKV